MKFSDEIIKVFDALAEKMGVVIDWTSKNIVPYIIDLFERWQKYEIILTIIWFITFFMVCILCILSLCVVLQNRTADRKSIYDIFYDIEYIYDGYAHYCKPFHGKYEEKIIFSFVGGFTITISVILLIIVGLIEIGLLSRIIKLITIPELVFYETFM